MQMYKNMANQLYFMCVHPFTSENTEYETGC